MRADDEPAPLKDFRSVEVIGAALSKGTRHSSSSVFVSQFLIARTGLSMEIIVDISIQNALLVFNLHRIHLKLAHVHLRVFFP